GSSRSVSSGHRTSAGVCSRAARPAFTSTRSIARTRRRWSSITYEDDTLRQSNEQAEDRSEGRDQVRLQHRDLEQLEGRRRRPVTESSPDRAREDPGAPTSDARLGDADREAQYRTRGDLDRPPTDHDAAGRADEVAERLS